MLGRVRDAVSDLTETLRRVFQPPPSHSLTPASWRPSSHAAEAFAACPRLPPYRLEISPSAADLDFCAAQGIPWRELTATVQSEEALARWASGVEALVMPVFSAKARPPVAIPALPRRAEGRRVEVEGYRTSTQGLSPGIPVPRVRPGHSAIEAAAVRGGIGIILGIPIAFTPQDVQSLPKAQWMRFSLQLVKSTGENIRNLEILGLFRIPAKGVAGMRHDAKTGRLLLDLHREAGGAPRVPFILARRKDDQTLVSCFLEEG